MRARDPKQEQPLFSPETRAALRRELGPDAHAQARVRGALWSHVATGSLSPAAQRIDALLQAKASATATQAAGTASIKTTLAATVHSVTGKVILVGILVGGAGTAAVMRSAPASDHAAVAKPQLAAPMLERTSPASDHAAVAKPQLAAPMLERTSPASEYAAVAKPQHTAPMLEVAVHPETPAAPLPEPDLGATPLPAAPPHTTAAAPRSQHQRRERTPQTRSLERAPAVSSEAPAAPQQVTSSSSPPQEQLAENVQAPTAPEPRPQHELGAELQLVRAASDALQRRDTDSALAQLQRHAALFPRGALRVEVEALRAIALCLAESDDSAAVSGRFLELHASGPLAERVRRACRPR
jgi:hypothetical protein